MTMFEFCNSRMKELYNESSPEVKQQVEEHRMGNKGGTAEATDEEANYKVQE